MKIVVTRYSDPHSAHRYIFKDEHANGHDFRTGNGGQLEILDNMGRNIKAYGAGIWIDVERLG